MLFFEVFKKPVDKALWDTV